MYSNTWMMEQSNVDFIFVVDEDNQSFEANLHRELFQSELLCWCHYLDMTRLELRVAYYRVVASYWLEYKLGRLDMSINNHFHCYNGIISEMFEMKRKQCREKRDLEATEKELAAFLTQ